jgi:hypothetical protein
MINKPEVAANGCIERDHPTVSFKASDKVDGGEGEAGN